MYSVQAGLFICVRRYNWQKKSLPRKKPLPIRPLVASPYSTPSRSSNRTSRGRKRLSGRKKRSLVSLKPNCRRKETKSSLLNGRLTLRRRVLRLRRTSCVRRRRELRDSARKPPKRRRSSPAESPRYLRSRSSSSRAKRTSSAGRKNLLGKRARSPRSGTRCSPRKRPT